VSDMMQVQWSTAAFRESI